ncbi:MAG: tyrosine-protein phosphatase [Eubacterium sp.]|nr:tyrosine-protein phosphatase [Eubacterium sp.]
MQFYDLYKDIISYIPEKYVLIQSAADFILPFVLMACALVTAFFGLKCVGWWIKVSFFLFGTGAASKLLIKNVDFYDFYFWLFLGISLAAGIFCALVSKYLSRLELAGSEFLIIYAALPSFFSVLGKLPAQLISIIAALCVVFLTVKYKYLIIIPTTSFSGSLLFWQMLSRYVEVGDERLWGITMGVAAFGFQCLTSREKIKETCKDVKKKAKTTKNEGERFMRFVERKHHTEGVNIKNIRVKGVKNLRDLGGLPVEGGRVKPKKLLRSGCLYKINKKGAGFLSEALNLHTVIDLRNSAEKAEKPDYEIEGVSYHELHVFDSTIPGLSHEEKKVDLNKVPLMTELYAAVMNGDSVMNLCNAVRFIVLSEEKEFSVLYHCTEGKDRTGMVTAVLLMLLGAEREVILEDYLYTNKQNLKKALGYFLLVRIFKNNLPAAKRVFGVFIAREEYINEVFKFIDKVGFDKFKSEYLKLTDGDIERFKANVVE